MKPIYDEQIKMWEDLGVKYSFPHETLWFDNNFIQAFTPDGKLNKLYKYKVNDDLSIIITEYKDYTALKKYYSSINKELKFETWSETVQRMKPYIKKITNRTERILHHNIRRFPNSKIIVLTSTGKDSMVVLDFMQKSGYEFETVFNNTSLDCADTYKMVNKHKDWIITNPEIGFYKWIQQENYIPTRFSRGCCSIFKEGEYVTYLKNKNYDNVVNIMGVRNSESENRKDRKFITKNPKWGGYNWYGILPIRKWSEFDVWLYTLYNNLEVNPKYKKGYSRVGCAISCPYYTKYTWVLDKYFYPTMYNRWHNILEVDFVENQRWTKLNCTVEEYHSCWNGGILRPEPTEEVVKEFMEYKHLDNKETAMKYFNKTCKVCGRNVRQNEVIAMNLKLMGREINEFYCKKHFKEFYKIDEDKFLEMIKDFKSQKCNLF